MAPILASELTCIVDLKIQSDDEVHEILLTEIFKQPRPQNSIKYVQHSDTPLPFFCSHN